MTTASNVKAVVVWWTPECGHIHVESDPTSISFACSAEGKPQP